MNATFREGDTLQARFELRAALRAHASGHTRSQVWLAHDRRLESDVLLRLYHVGEAEHERPMQEAIRVALLRHRALHHPSLARVCDLHEHDGVPFVSMVPAGGELLGTYLHREGPVPYRTAIDRLRPLIDALQHVHEQGGEHRRLDLDHVLVQDDRWWLLPADATKPAARDVRRLGAVFVATLTGARPPEGGREINDVAERLHAGRTVPALLNQLVTDLTSVDAHRQPRGMHEVMRRLEQLDEFLATAVTAESGSGRAHTPANTSPPPAPPALEVAGQGSSSSASSAPKARRPLAPLAAALLIPAAIVGGFVLYGQTRPRVEESAAPAVVEAEPANVDPADAQAAPNGGAWEPANTVVVDEAARQHAKAAADEALGSVLMARREVEQIGGSVWGGAPYAAAADLAVAADAAYLAEDYTSASERYASAADGFRAVFDAREATFERLLDEGRRALADGDAELAATALEHALLIEPGHPEATRGTQRARTLGPLNTLMARGRGHEDAGRLAEALADFTEARRLDPLSEEANAAEQRIKDRIADEAFSALMARGLQAFHAGAYDDARARLLEARDFRPQSAEVANALEMVREARVRAEVERLHTVADVHERNEDWQQAWNAYREVLAIDALIEFAQKGRARCEETMTIQAQAQRYLDDPELSIKAASRDEAPRVLAELDRIRHRGAGLEAMHGRLAAQVRLANTPHRVELRSDGRTEVAVYRVRRFGVFESKQIELVPGYYTVVGSRSGYKDVRSTLHVRPGAASTTISIVCREPIR